MSKFPDPIPLCENVSKAREQRNHHILWAARWGVIFRLCIILLEMAGFIWYGSSALLLDAIASSLDIFCSLILIIFIKLAARPPDKNHPFGHGRYEPLAGLQLGLLLILIGGGMIFQQFFELSKVKSTTVIGGYVWIIPFVATILLEICYQFMIRAAKRENSPALAADAAHYRIDGLTSLFATVALAIGAYFPLWSVIFDHIGAILISCFMIIIGFYSARNNMHQLMDRVPEDHFFARVKEASMRVSGVLETEKLRIQLYGPDAHVDIDVEVSPELQVDQAHRISQQVRREIQKEWPAVRDVTVHIEPYYPHGH